MRASQGATSAPPRPRTLPQVTELFTPLRGLCPIPGRAAEIAELPYDVMSRDEAIVMAEGRPNSFLHVSRPDIDVPPGTPAEQTHALAAGALARLVDDGLLVRDAQEQFHLYRMTDGTHRQTGIVGAASIAAYESGRIRRHETTRPDKQAERARQIDAVNAQTGPVYLVHRPDVVVEQVVAEITATPAPTVVDGPGGVRHEVWPVSDDDAIARLVKSFEAMPALYIADGHHRSAAAAAVHAERGTHASGRFLAVSFPTDQVRILPYNRVVRAPDGGSGAEIVDALAERFQLEPAPGAVLPAKPGQVGLYADGRWFTPHPAGSGAGPGRGRDGRGRRVRPRRRLSAAAGARAAPGHLRPAHRPADRLRRRGATAQPAGGRGRRRHLDGRLHDAPDLDRPAARGG